MRGGARGARTAAPLPAPGGDGLVPLDHAHPRRPGRRPARPQDVRVHGLGAGGAERRGDRQLRQAESAVRAAAAREARPEQRLRARHRQAVSLLVLAAAHERRRQSARL